MKLSKPKNIDLVVQELLNAFDVVVKTRILRLPTTTVQHFKEGRLMTIFVAVCVIKEQIVFLTIYFQ